MRHTKLWLVLACIGGLTACGDTAGEQALIGSSVGAGAAVLLDGNLLAGAAVGAAGNILYCQQYPGRC